MKSNLFFLILLLGCNSTLNKRSNIAQLDFNILPKNSISSKNLYGINIDSMLIKTKNISWGESFSDILSKNQIDNGVIFKAIQKSKTIFNLKQLKKGKNYTLLFDLNNPKPSYFIYEPDVYTALIYYLGDSVFVKEHKNLKIL